MKRLHAFFFAPASPRPFAALRISVSAVLLLQAIFLAPEILDLYGGNGIFQGDLNRFLLTERLPFYIDWLRLGGDGMIRGLFLAYVGALGLLLVGLHCRLAAFAAWATHFAIKINQGYLSSYGVDTFALIFLFYFLFVPIGRTWSIDAKLHPERPLDDGWNRFALRVLQAHLFIVYTSSGIAKIAGDQWRSGEVMWRALNLPQFSVIDMTWLHHVPWVATAIAWGTLFLEIGYPIVVGVPRLRKFGALAVAGMHFGIAGLMGLWSFGFFMAGLTLSCFLVSEAPRFDASGLEGYGSSDKGGSWILSPVHSESASVC